MSPFISVTLDPKVAEYYAARLGFVLSLEMFPNEMIDPVAELSRAIGTCGDESEKRRMEQAMKMAQEDSEFLVPVPIPFERIENIQFISS